MHYVYTAVVSFGLGYAARSDRGQKFIAAIIAKIKPR